jgi:hypothetical protein
VIEVFAPHLGRTVKLGRKKRPSPARCLRFGDYLRKSLPDPPSAVDYSAKAMPALTDIMGNDNLGDCVIAASYHLLAVLTGNATGTPFHATLEQVVADYSAIGGYVPGNPATDDGCDISTALDYYASHGFANGDKLLGHVSLDPTSITEVQSASFLLENTWVGVDLPAAWISPMPSASGFTWDVAGDPVPANGHCFCVVGYDPMGLLIDTWGLLGRLTYAAVAKYCSAAGGGDLYVALAPDQMAKGASLAPNGVAWADLIADFDAMGGAVAPIAASPIVPATGPLTLAMAQAAAAAGLNQANMLMTKAQAIQHAAQGLAAAWPRS